MGVFSALFLSQSLRPHPWFASAVFLCWSAWRDSSLCRLLRARKFVESVWVILPAGKQCVGAVKVSAWQRKAIHVEPRCRVILWAWPSILGTSACYRWHEHKQFNFVRALSFRSPESTPPGPQFAQSFRSRQSVAVAARVHLALEGLLQTSERLPFVVI